MSKNSYLYNMFYLQNIQFEQEYNSFARIIDLTNRTTQNQNEMPETPRTGDEINKCQTRATSSQTKSFS